MLLISVIDSSLITRDHTPFLNLSLSWVYKVHLVIGDWAAFFTQGERAGPLNTTVDNTMSIGLRIAVGELLQCFWVGEVDVISGGNELFLALPVTTAVVSFGARVVRRRCWGGRVITQWIDDILVLWPPATIRRVQLLTCCRFKTLLPPAAQFLLLLAAAEDEVKFFGGISALFLYWILVHCILTSGIERSAGCIICLLVELSTFLVFLLCWMLYYLFLPRETLIVGPDVLDHHSHENFEHFFEWPFRGIISAICITTLKVATRRSTVSQHIHHACHPPRRVLQRLLHLMTQMAGASGAVEQFWSVKCFNAAIKDLLLLIILLWVLLRSTGAERVTILLIHLSWDPLGGK